MPTASEEPEEHICARCHKRTSRGEGAGALWTCAQCLDLPLPGASLHVCHTCYRHSFCEGAALTFKYWCIDCGKGELYLSQSNWQCLACGKKSEEPFGTMVGLCKYFNAAAERVTEEWQQQRWKFLKTLYDRGILEPLPRY